MIYAPTRPPEREAGIVVASAHRPLFLKRNGEDDSGLRVPARASPAVLGFEMTIRVLADRDELERAAAEQAANLIRQAVAARGPEQEMGG